MKKVALAFMWLFTLLTFIGGAYVLLNKGSVNAGYAVVPSVLGIACSSIFHSLKDREKEPGGTQAKWLDALMVLYFVPYSYLAVYGDITFGSMALYLLPVCAFSALCVVTVKMGSMWHLIVGNILSFVSSYACAHLFITEKWGWYFKPLTGAQIVSGISFLAMVIQFSIGIGCFIKKRRNTEDT